jgi:signal peptidase I
MKDKIMTVPADRESGSRKALLLDYAKSILIAVVLALFIRTFVVQAFEIPSGSMENTLQIGDHILVNKFIFGTRIPFTDIRLLPVRQPERGDVIVFVYPKDRQKDFIKRVVGVPGDRIRMVNKKVYVNDKLYVNPHEIHKDTNVILGMASPRDNMNTIVVPPDSYFVMGDNRDNSYDSRFWGFVKKSDLLGLAFIKYWSWDSNTWNVRWKNIGALIN